MARTKSASVTTEVAEQAADPIPTAVAPPRAEEPTTVTVSAKMLAEALASYAFALAAFGADTLSPEGTAAFTAITAALCGADAKAQAHYDVPVAAAFWISTDLMGSRHRRPALTGGEVALGTAVSLQAPKLAHRLAAQTAQRRPQPGEGRVFRPPVESPSYNPDPHNMKFPDGQHFDYLGRPVGPKPTIRIA